MTGTAGRSGAARALSTISGPMPAGSPTVTARRGEFWTGTEVRIGRGGDGVTRQESDRSAGRGKWGGFQPPHTPLGACPSDVLHGMHLEVALHALFRLRLGLAAAGLALHLHRLAGALHAAGHGALVADVVVHLERSRGAD